MSMQTEIEYRIDQAWVREMFNKIEALREQLTYNRKGIAKTVDAMINDIVLKYEHYCKNNKTYANAGWMTVKELINGLRDLSRGEVKDLAERLDHDMSMWLQSLFIKGDEDACWVLDDMAKVAASINCIARGCDCGSINYINMSIRCFINCNNPISIRGCE